MFNLFSCIKDANVSATLSLSDLVERIKNNPNAVAIEELRSGNYTKEEIAKFKCNQPAVTLNFRYNNYKRDENIISSTGYLYIDIDTPSFDVSRLDMSKVALLYKSISGRGFGMLVRVEGLTKENFKSAYQYITAELSLTEFCDKGAMKASQYNIISYDKDVVFNPSSFIFNVSTVPPMNVYRETEKDNKNNTNQLYPLLKYIEEEKAYTFIGGTPLRYDNLDEIEIADEDRYIVNWSGWKYVKCFIPMKKKATGRRMMLLDYARNLVWLNPHITYELLVDVLDSVSNIHFAVPLPFKRIHSIATSIMKYHSEGVLKPKYFNKTRKILFNKKHKIQKEEKNSIVLQEVYINRVNTSINKLIEILNSWSFESNGGISIRNISRNHAISKKTVAKYYNQFKSDIHKMNDEFKVSGTTTHKIALESIPAATVDEKLSDNTTVIENNEGLNQAINEAMLKSDKKFSEMLSGVPKSSQDNYIEFVLIEAKTVQEACYILERLKEFKAA